MPVEGARPRTKADGRFMPMDVRSVPKNRKPDVAGRSKALYILGGGRCFVRMKPTLDSFTRDRHEVLPGTEKLRLDFYELAAAELERGGVRTAFVERVDEASYIARLCTVPPFETVVKGFAVGSTLRKYPGLFPEMHRFDPPVVKFDYRVEPEDQPIGDDYLKAAGLDPDLFRRRARCAFDVLCAWLSPLVLVDICFVFGFVGDDRDPVLVSEVSPDCMRLRDDRGRSYDKDLFRRGAGGPEIVRAWRGLVEMVSGEGGP